MKLFWKSYAFLFFAIILGNALQILNKNSSFGMYYNATMAFSPWYTIPYFFNILNTLLECIVCLFLFGYAFDIKNLSRAPYWLFYLRIFSECTGHTYEVKMIQASFTSGKLLGLAGFAFLIIPILPSYLVQWRMTFRRSTF